MTGGGAAESWEAAPTEETGERKTASTIFGAQQPALQRVALWHLSHGQPAASDASGRHAPCPLRVRPGEVEELPNGEHRPHAASPHVAEQALCKGLDVSRVGAAHGGGAIFAVLSRPGANGSRKSVPVRLGVAGSHKSDQLRRHLIHAPVPHARKKRASQSARPSSPPARPQGEPRPATGQRGDWSDGAFGEAGAACVLAGVGRGSRPAALQSMYPAAGRGASVGGRVWAASQSPGPQRGDVRAGHERRRWRPPVTQARPRRLR